MADWIRVASVADCPPGSARELVVGDRMVALFHVEGRFYAMDGVCPHQGGPLGRGTLSGCLLTCPWHGWQFDVRDGHYAASASLRHPSFPVKVEGDDVFVDVNG